MLSRVQKTVKNMWNIKNFTTLKVIARHFCFIFIANIDDFDVAGLLVFIFVQKGLDRDEKAMGIYMAEYVASFS